MAWTAHKNEEDIKELYDSPEKFNKKVMRLAQYIRESKHFVIFTGAGISTSAGIPDFRGPQGVWTLAAKNEKRTAPTVSVIKALPTATHMSIVKLQEENICKFLITQNCDGLHRRSGLHPEKIAELHGNGNVEECEKCQRKYFRDFTAYRLSHVSDHFTGRYCVAPGCGGRLLEWTIDFGQNLPEREITSGFLNAKKADLHLVLGSSLTVSPACTMPEKTSKHGKLVICNLQKTPLDDVCHLRIFSKTDDLMIALMKELNLEIPEWSLHRKFLISTTHNGMEFKVSIQGIDPFDVNLPATIFKSVDFVTVKKTQNKEPFEIEEKVNSSFPKQFNVVLHFMRHYGRNLHLMKFFF